MRHKADTVLIPRSIVVPSSLGYFVIADAADPGSEGGIGKDDNSHHVIDLFVTGKLLLR